MYDPTVFENLKVAFENHVYDLDNLDCAITIGNRVDRMDFSILTREFAIQFSKLDQPNVTAEIVLEAKLEDLAGEILELPNSNFGCSLMLRFCKKVEEVDIQCSKIEQTLNGIWEDEIEISQTLSFNYKQEASGYENTIEVKFKQKMNEENMSEIGEFLHHVLITLDMLFEI
ncbi:hypothetical protein [Bacillus niameyensis]|uniref:hypothetical protein n=1 Tax=Bacillus niameyensis TaxID=1522308 RepID=UPI000783789F|nr:hypothetical protein [Bacillus niameyensis]